MTYMGENSVGHHNLRIINCKRVLKERKCCQQKELSQTYFSSFATCIILILILGAVANFLRFSMARF